MGRCLAMGWGPVITGAGWGRGAVQAEVHVEELATHMEGKEGRDTSTVYDNLPVGYIVDKRKAHQVCINMCMIPYDFVM